MERHQPYVRAVAAPSHRYEEGPSRPRTRTHRNEKYMPPLLSAHNFCMSPTEIVYTLEKLETKVKWPPKMSSDPNTRKSDALCEFHQERENKTEDCISLKQEVINMSRQGHLKELLRDKGRTNFARGREHQGPPKSPSLAHTINMIIGGDDDTSINDVKFTTTHKLKRSIIREWYSGLEESIIFDESDADSLTFPHNDALGITICILDTDVKCNMVDDRSGACIIHPRVFTQMRLEDKIMSLCITLTGFNNAVERTSGEITLLVLAGGMTLETTFHIMEHATMYNAIVGRLWIHPMRAIPSSLYQAIKFPTLWGIFSIRGEQRTSRECYCIALDSIATQQKKTKKKRNTNQQG
ncbi:uncharacterized protein [Nicotiana tomentosiformis]|uniref:uncharacterized protein n=1 Tax=Nicotiana tomentosiformis TaxID=4098 RepID=UPI00051BDB8B|nr:uncharacterized protein LOC104116794 [Nicotiana tomentosiformis]